jgi:hypothetical protein
MSDFALPSAAGQRTAFFKRRSTDWIGASLVVLGLVPSPPEARGAEAKGEALRHREVMSAFE